MIKMQKIYLTLILIGIFIISGCVNLNPDKGTVTTSSLYTGTSGLELSFVKSAPPSRVFEDTPFNAIVDIKNKGAYDIGLNEGEETNDKGIFVMTPETGYVSLTQIEKSGGVVETVDPDVNKAGFVVRGRSLSDPIGDELLVYSNLNAKKLDSLSSIHASSVFATVCYPYQTKISASVCIDEDIYDLDSGKKACESKNLAFSGGQGAPVAVTKIEVQMIPEGDKMKPEFLIYVENKGKGEVVKRDGYAEACKSGIGGRDDKLGKYFNVINVISEESKLSDKLLVCGPEDQKNVVVLSGKNGIIRCSPESWGSENEGAYVAPLNLVLEYGYTTTISKEFNIEKPLK